MHQSPQKQTSRSILRNVFYGSMTWVLPVFMGLIATPVLIRSLGNNDYGIYALVLGFISYSFTFNFGRAITKFVAEYRSTGETGKIRDVISATIFLNVAVGTAGGLVTCLLAGYLVRDVFRIDATSQTQAVHAIYVSTVVIFLWMFSTVFTSVLQGVHRFDVYSKIYAVSSFVLTSGNVLIAYSGFGLVWLLIWNASVIAVFLVVYGIAARRLLPEFAISLRPHSATLRLVMRYSAGIVAYQVLANILLLFERGWIANRLGTEALTYYVVPMSLGLYMHGFVGSLVLVVFPLASELNNDRDKLLRLYTKATKVIGLIVVFIVCSMVVNGETFLRLWMGPDFADTSTDLLMIHMASFGFIAVMSVSWQMTEGLGYPQFNALTTGLSTIIGIVFMLLLTQRMGSTGVALARLAGFAFVFLSVFVVERRFFGAVQKSFWLRLASGLAVAAGAAAGIEYLIVQALSGSWLVLALSIFLGGCTYLTTLWFLDFVTGDEKLLIRQVFSR
jgi:O-antigen/teichoic acid export membrane protein